MISHFKEKIMPRPKGSLNKVQPQAKILQKKPTKVVCRGEDIEQVNKMLSSFVESVEEETKNRQEKPQEDKSVESLGDFLKRINEEAEKELTPEEKVEHLEEMVRDLREAIDRHRVVIDYLEQKLGIEE
jgi:predicted RNase H-like nuclease (RuvC/YqgF family)